MFYTPKCCSECGNEIEPDGLKFLPNRFCEVCAPNFKLQRFFPLIWMSCGAIMMIFGFGTYLKKPDKPLNLSTMATANASNKNQNSSSSQILTNAVVQPNGQKPDVGNISSSPSNSPILATTEQKSSVAKRTSADDAQNSGDEAIYICGARTKKGTACLRKVKKDWTPLSVYYIETSFKISARHSH